MILLVYATVARVRELSGTVDTEFVAGNGTTSIQTRRDFHSINAIKVDGVANENFTTTQPRTITFTDGAKTTANKIEISADLYLTDNEVQSFINETDAMVDSYLNDVYSVPFTATFPAIIVLASALLSASRIITNLNVKVNRADGAALADALRTEGLELIGKLQSGKITIPGLSSQGGLGIQVSSSGNKKVFATRPDLNETWREWTDGRDRDENQNYGNGDLQG